MSEPQPNAYAKWNVPELDNKNKQKTISEITEPAEEKNNAVSVLEAELQQKLVNSSELEKKLSSLLNSLTQSLVEFEESIEQKVLAMVCKISSAVVKHEVSVNKTYISDLVKEGLMEFLDSNNKINIHLAAEDRKIIHELISSDILVEKNISIIEDNAITPGGCIIRSEHSSMNLSLEDRMNMVLSKLQN